jgi:hypothetical protein
MIARSMQMGAADYGGDPETEAHAILVKDRANNALVKILVGVSGTTDLPETTQQRRSWHFLRAGTKAVLSQFTRCPHIFCQRTRREHAVRDSVGLRL